MQGVLFRGVSSNGGTLSRFDKGAIDAYKYTYTMKPEALEKQSEVALFELPCACQNLRRVTRVVTRIYDQELRKAGLEITQLACLPPWLRLKRPIKSGRVRALLWIVRR